MKSYLHLGLLIAITSSMTACFGPLSSSGNGPRGRSLDVPHRYGMPAEVPHYPEDGQVGDPNAAVVQPIDTNAPVTGGAVTPPVPDGAPPTVPVAPPTTPPPAPAPAEVPFAIRITGKPGYVKSPFDPSGQAIDVRDFHSGQKARCPYTGKVFRVP